MNKLTCFSVVISFILITTCSLAQTITSNQDGLWNDASTWAGGVIPTTANSTEIIVNHNISIPSAYSVTVDGMTVNAVVTINTGGTLTILSEGSPGFSQNYIYGTLIRQDNSNLTGTTGNNLVFQSGSVYSHLFTTTQGSIPLASWHVNSTLQVEGYTTFTVGSAGGNWSQSFGNVVWNCPLQTGTFNMNGLLTSVAGNFRVLSTGTGVFQMATTQNPTIAIGGNLTVEGTSRVRLSTTGAAPGTIYNVTGDFIYTSTNATGSDLTTSGICTINIGSDFSMNAPGGLLAVSRNGTDVLNIAGNFELISGTFSEVGVGSGSINFVSPGVDHTFLNTGTISNVSLLNYSIPASHSLRLIGESQMMGGNGSSLTVSGTVIVESENATGAIVTGSSSGVGNIRVANRIFNAGSRIVYGGSNPQFIGAGHTSTSGVDTEINNASGVSIELGAPTSLTLGNDLYVTTGNLNIGNDNLIVPGNVYLTGGDLLLNTTTLERTLQIDGEISLTGGSINVNSGDADAILVVNGTISGSNTIAFNGDNSNLEINGSGSLGMDFPLPGVTSVESISVDRTDATIAFSNDLTTLDLTVVNGSVDMNAALVILDDLNLATGTTLYIEDHSLDLQSQFNNTLSGGVISSSATSSVTITGTGTLGTLSFSPTGNVLGTFILNRSTTGTLVTLESPLTISNTFTLTDGIFDNISGLTFGNGATVTRNSAASFTGTSAIPLGGPYNLIYTGGTMSTGAEARGVLNAVTCNAGTITLTTALNASGIFTLTSGTFTSGANTVLVSSLVISAGTFNAPSSTLSLSGDLTNNSTFNRNNGTVNFNGTSSILGTSNPSFQNIVISGTLTSPTTLNIYGSFTNNGSFVAGTNTVAFLGTAGVTQVVSGSSITTFNNATVANTTASPDLRIENNQNLRGILTLAANATMDADGAADTAVFTLLSTDDDPSVDAAIGILSGTSQVLGSVTVQRYMSIEGGSNSPTFNNGRIYRYISSPVQNAIVQDIQGEIPVTGSFTGTSVCSGCGTFQSMFSYSELTVTDTNGDGVNDSNDGYQDFPVNGNKEVLVTGKGYTLFIRGNIPPISTRGNALWDVRNPINSGTVNFSPLVSYTSSGNNANDGWNLVGNPYPSMIDWDAATGWTKTGLTNTIYMVDNAVSPFIYATYNGTIGVNGGTRYIPLGQAFFVKSNGGPITFSATESVKAPTGQGTFFREEAPANVLRITLRQGTNRDETAIHFRDDATEQFDDYADAFKLQNNALNLSSSLDDGTKISINSLPALSCNKTIKLNVDNVEAGSYKLDFMEIESFTNNVIISLSDKFTGTSIDVNTVRSYEFAVTSDPKSFGSDRFEITVSPSYTSEFSLSTTKNSFCKGEDVSIHLNNTTSAYDYVVTIGDEEVSSQAGNGSTLEISLPKEKLVIGANILKVTEKTSKCEVVIKKQVTSLNVEEIQQANISIEGENILVSNFESGNTWYLNGTIIGGERLLNVYESGEYQLKVTQGSCITVSKQDITIKGSESDLSLEGYRIYPNPVSLGTMLVVEAKELNATELPVVNSMGLVIGRILMQPKEGYGYIGKFDLTEFPSGVYFVSIKNENKIKIFKVLSLK